MSASGRCFNPQSEDARGWTGNTLEQRRVRSDMKEHNMNRICSPRLYGCVALAAASYAAELQNPRHERAPRFLPVDVFGAYNPHSTKHRA